MEKLILTGSTGNVGSKLVDPISIAYHLYEVDSTFAEEEWFRGKLKADISDIGQLRRAFAQVRNARYVIHLAGDPRVNAPWESVLKNNIVGTHNLYECAKEYNVKRVIYASSNHVTGGYEGVPPTLHMRDSGEIITTAHPIRPDGDYGTSKAFGEATARQYYELYGIESLCLRIGTVVPDDSPTYDDRVRKTWLSQRDLVQLVLAALTSPVKFGIYYGVSDNNGRFWDIANANEELVYHSVDDASQI